MRALIWPRMDPTVIEIPPGMPRLFSTMHWRAFVGNMGVTGRQGHGEVGKYLVLPNPLHRKHSLALLFC